MVCDGCIHIDKDLTLSRDGFGDGFGYRAQGSFGSFINLVTIGFPLAAVLLALLVHPRHPKAEVIVVTAGPMVALGAMADATRLVFGGPAFLYVLLFAAVSAGLQVFLQYTRYVAVLKWLALVLLSYVIGPTPMDLQFWRGAVAMMIIAAMTASLVTNTGRSAWFVGTLVLTVYVIFGMTLYLLPPRV